MNPHGLGSKAFPIRFGAHLGRRSSHLYKAAGNSTLMFIIVIRKWTAFPLRERERVVRYEGRYIPSGALRGVVLLDAFWNMKMEFAFDPLHG